MTETAAKPETFGKICANDLRPCDRCGGKLSLQVFRVKIEPMIIDASAAQRALSEAAMMGPLAGAMGTNPEVAIGFTKPVRLLICQICALEARVAELAEIEK